jgi:hypothetical protein
MNENTPIPVEERVRRGPGEALGDTGDGPTGVAPETQGISNRRGDWDGDTALDIDEDALAVRDGADEGATGDTPADEEELVDADEDDDDDDDDEGDEVNDPEAEPGKPI